MVGKRVWMAMAMAVPSRLWLGGVISVHRDLALITNLVQMVRTCALSLVILVCVDGLASYVTAFRRGVRRPAEAGLGARPRATNGVKGINTAYIERLNATFRGALVPLVRRGRAIAHKEAVLTAGMYLVGCAYNFCWYHESLRLTAPEGASRKWQERTPAMAAGLTDHCWTMLELLGYQVPLPAWVAPKRRGRPPKQAQQPTPAGAA